MASYLFSSESVTEGHPDKLCDQVSDAILDACLTTDPHSRVACETVAKTGFVLVAGEITTKAQLDFQRIIRGTVNDIGFNRGFNCKLTPHALTNAVNNLPFHLRIRTREVNIFETA